MAAGITQPGGAGTTIFVYDDSDTSGGRASGPYTFAQIATAFPADFVDNATNAKSYRAKVSVQIGDTGVGTATTTITDTDSTVLWDNTKTLVWRATQTTSWNLNLGTKVGSGNTASGKQGSVLIFGAATTARGNMAIYGATLKTTSGVLQASHVVGTTVDIQNTLLQSVASGTTPLGFSFSGTGNLYNVDVSHVTTAQVLNTFLTSSAERITACATAPSSFLLTGIINLAVKDFKMFGTPSLSDIRWASAAPTNWQLVRPGFTGFAPKFSSATGALALAQATWEYWLWDVKVVDGSGAGVSGVPVKLTDAVGEVQVDTTTGSDGQVVFGSGLTTNAVKVMDHYSVAGVYTQRHRSPFLVEINTGASALVGYQARRYYFNWPGYESITTSSGTFDDVADIVSLGEPSGPATNWVELTL